MDKIYERDNIDYGYDKDRDNPFGAGQMIPNPERQNFPLNVPKTPDDLAQRMEKFRENLERLKPVQTQPAPMQAFTTGATRSDDSSKNDYEGFLSPLVLEAYADYMTEHRIQDDGRVRASDNWQLGIPLHKFMKSLLRHVLQLWQLHRGYVPKPEKRAGKLVQVTVESASAGVIFNIQGYFHEYLMDMEGWQKRVVSEPNNADKLLVTDVRKQKAAV